MIRFDTWQASWKYLCIGAVSLPLLTTKAALVELLICYSLLPVFGLSVFLTFNCTCVLIIPRDIYMIYLSGAVEEALFRRVQVRKEIFLRK